MSHSFKLNHILLAFVVLSLCFLAVTSLGVAWQQTAQRTIPPGTVPISGHLHGGPNLIRPGDVACIQLGDDSPGCFFTHDEGVRLIGVDAVP